MGFAESGAFVGGKPVAYLDAVGDCYQIIKQYEVGVGDSVATAAAFFTVPGGEPWVEVAEFNGISPPYEVQPGQVVANPRYRQRFDRLAEGVRGLYPRLVDGAWVDPDGDPVWGPSVGWFQVRSLRDPQAYGPFTGDRRPVRGLDFLAESAEHQAAAARIISGGGDDWSPWTAYRSGAWKRLSDAGFDDYELVTGHPRADRWNPEGVPQ